MPKQGLVPVDPEQQPPIRTFISECRKASLTGATSRRIATKVVNKKRHLSTDDKRGSEKRRPTSSTDRSSRKSVESIPELSTKMASITVNPEGKDPTLMAIEGLETRLTASMKENREKEIAKMEERLKSNMKEVIENSIQRAIEMMGSTIHQMIANNPLVTKNSTEVSELKQENIRLKKELQYLSAEQGKLESRMERIENRNLENCVIFRGIREDFKETDEVGREKIYRELSNLLTEEDPEERHKMARRLVIRRCKRLGRYNRDRPRPFSIEFVHHEDVAFIMENRGYLSNGVYVNREFSPEIERRHRTMLPILRAARFIDGYKKQIRLDKDKIVIKGKDYDMSNIHDLPEDLNAFTVTSKENDEVVGYFGELNPLSNFFPAPFTLNGINYISSEQFIQASKAQYFGDTDMLNQVMGCKTSADCKDFSRKIRGVDSAKWDSVAADVCRVGIREKFVQNPILLEILVRRTSNKRIVECAKDRLWGTGTALAQENCLNSDRWITPGIMGKLLEEIRAEFSSQFQIAPLPSALSGVHHNSSSLPSSGNNPTTQYAEGPSGPLFGIQSDPVSSSLPPSRNNPTAQYAEGPPGPLFGVQNDPVSTADPSELRSSMFASLNERSVIKDVSMETSSPQCEPTKSLEPSTIVC